MVIVVDSTNLKMVYLLIVSYDVCVCVCVCGYIYFLQRFEEYIKDKGCAKFMSSIKFSHLS